MGWMEIHKATTQQPQIKTPKAVNHDVSSELFNLAQMQKQHFRVMEIMLKGLQDISNTPLTLNSSVVMKDIARNTADKAIEVLEGKSNV